MRTKRMNTTHWAAIVVLSLVLVIPYSFAETPASPSVSMAGATSTDLVPSSIPIVDTVFAGYFLLNPNHGAVTAISEKYSQPKETCITGENASGSYVGSQNAFVGPGLYDGNPAISNFAIYQMGTEALCQPFFHSPVYIPFYYWMAVRPSDPPNPDVLMHPIPGVSVSAGDSIESVMQASAGTITFTFQDLTTHRSGSTTVQAPSFDPNGAFCILNVFGNLARFSSFRQSCAPTVSGQSAGIGDFASPNSAFRAVMVNGTGAVQAATSSLDSDGSTFSITWHTSQPLGPVFSPGQVPLFPGSHVAGYLALGGYRGSVESVSDTYTQPSATCSAGEPVENATGHYPNDQTAFVGPGLYAGNTALSSFRFFQVGTEAYCTIFFGAPVYVPFYLTEIVTPSDPDGDLALVALPGLTVHPGDVMHATVRVSEPDDGGSAWVTFVLTDRTTGETAAATLQTTGFEPNGGACIMTPMINTAKFTNIVQSCRAIIDGETDGIGDFGASATLFRFDLLSPINTTVVQARTSGLSDDGATFTVEWLTSQPFGF